MSFTFLTANKPVVAKSVVIRQTTIRIVCNYLEIFFGSLQLSLAVKKVSQIVEFKGLFFPHGYPHLFHLRYGGEKLYLGAET